MEIQRDRKCECVGVRCGAHPLGACRKSPVLQYAFRLAANGAVVGNTYRLYCSACAIGLKATPYAGHSTEKKQEAVA